MPYIQRDINSKIKGIFARLQAGYAEEYLADNNAELLQHYADIKTKQDDLEAQRASDIAAFPTRAQIKTAIDNTTWTTAEKTIVKKLAMAVYTLLKNSVT